MSAIIVKMCLVPSLRPLNKNQLDSPWPVHTASRVNLSESGVSLWNWRQMFSAHTSSEEFKNATINHSVAEWLVWTVGQIIGKKCCFYNFSGKVETGPIFISHPVYSDLANCPLSKQWEITNIRFLCTSFRTFPVYHVPYEYTRWGLSRFIFLQQEAAKFS